MNYYKIYHYRNKCNLIELFFTIFTNFIINSIYDNFEKILYDIIKSIDIMLYYGFSKKSYIYFSDLFYNIKFI